MSWTDTSEPESGGQGLPGHVAIIMDGNGRWAEKRGLTRSEGHRAGTEAAKNVVTRCREVGIGHLTLYAFSRENWKRPRQEIEVLFDLLSRFVRGEQNKLLEQSIRLNLLGEPQGLPAGVRQLLYSVSSRTAQCREMVLNLALNYSGREEILQACRRMLSEGKDPEKIDEETFATYLSTQGVPDPDLIIRTSGEHRLSNFLLFQSAYSEFYFTDTLWPDFGGQELDLALQDFQNRCRRFGAAR